MRCNAHKLVGAVVGLAVLCGFDWPTSPTRHSHELRSRSAAEKRDWLPILAKDRSPGSIELLLRALEDPSPEVRLEAINLLHGPALAQAVPVLLDLLTVPIGAEEDGRLPVAAARAIGRSGDNRRAVPPLLAMLDRPAPKQRAAALLALGALREPSAADRALAMLQDPEAPVRVAAATALARIPAAHVVPAINAKLALAPADLQLALLETLAQRQDPSALPAVIKLAQHRVETKLEEAVRVRSLLTLGRLGGPAARRCLTGLLPTLPPRAAQAALQALASFDAGATSATLIATLDGGLLSESGQRALNQQATWLAAQGRTADLQALATALIASLDGNATATPEAIDARLSALAGLSRHTEISKATPTLVTLSATHSSPQLVRALANCNDKRAIGPLAIALASAQPATRRAARVGLQTLLADHRPTPAAVAQIVRQLETKPNLQTRAELIALLPEAAAAPFRASIVAELKSSQTASRATAVGAVARWGTAGDCEQLLPLLGLSSTGAAMPVAQAIAQCGDAQTLQRLVELLATAKSSRAPYLHAITELRGRVSQALPPSVQRQFEAQLQRLATGSSETDAIAAMHALGDTPAGFALPVIGKILRTPTDRRRAEAASVLGQFDAAAARPLLRFLLRQANPTIVLGALAAFGEVGDARDLAAVVKVAESKHWPVPQMVPYVVARWLARGAIPTRTAQRALCAWVDRPETAMRANAAAALAYTGSGACTPSGIGPAQFLALNRSVAERVAGAHWLRAAIQRHRIPEEQASALTKQCALWDPDAKVRDICSQLKPPPSDSVSVVQVATFAGPLSNWLVAIHFTDGTHLTTLTDESGRAYLPRRSSAIDHISDPGLMPVSTSAPSPTPTGPAATSAAPSPVNPTRR